MAYCGMKCSASFSSLMEKRGSKLWVIEATTRFRFFAGESIVSLRSDPLSSWGFCLLFGVWGVVGFYISVRVWAIVCRPVAFHLVLFPNFLLLKYTTV